MKISVIGPTYPYKGGISHFTTLLVRNLRKHHEVDFISWKRQYPAFLYPVEPKDTTSKYPILEDAKYLLDFMNPVTWYTTAHEIKKFNPHKVFITWINPVQAPIYYSLTSVIKRIIKTNITYICHNVLPHEASKLDKPLTKLALNTGDSFIVHSSDDKDILKSLIKNKPIKKAFLPLFEMFDTNIKYDKELTRRELHLKNKVLLFFGYIRPYKGLQYLIQAMPNILQKHPDASLLIVGEYWSKDKKSYDNLINSLHLENHIVSINKYVPNEELSKYFSVSDVVVLPYLSATQSAAVQTAYAFNKPVISTPVGGLKDVVKDGISGYVIKEKDPVDISKKVQLFFEKTIPEKNIEKVKHLFGWREYIRLFNI